MVNSIIGIPNKKSSKKGIIKISIIPFIYYLSNETPLL